MKTYNVNIYFHGCYSVDVKANDEDEALDLANELIEDMDDLEFLRAIDIQEDGNDVYEL